MQNGATSAWIHHDLPIFYRQGVPSTSGHTIMWQEFIFSVESPIFFCQGLFSAWCQKWVAQLAVQQVSTPIDLVSAAWIFWNHLKSTSQPSARIVRGVHSTSSSLALLEMRESMTQTTESHSEPQAPNVLATLLHMEGIHQIGPIIIESRRAFRQPNLGQEVPTLPMFSRKR